MNFSNRNIVMKDRCYEGGYGKVYVRNLFGREDIPIAVKELYPSRNDEEAFQGEVINLIKLNNQRVVRFLGYEDSGQKRKIYMEWLEGKNLDFYLTSEARNLGIRSRVRILSKICKAIQAVHSEGILHRDLKSDNIFICENDGNEIKLIDFGLASCNKDIDEGKANYEGVNIETAPPDCGGKIGILNIAGVVWTLGLLSLDILNSGKWGSAKAIREGGVKTIVWDDVVPKAIRKAVEKCLDNEPEQRYKNVRDFRLDIDEKTPTIDWRIEEEKEDLIIFEGSGAKLDGAIAQEKEFNERHRMYQLKIEGVRTGGKECKVTVSLYYKKYNSSDNFRKIKNATRDYVYNAGLIQKLIIMNVDKLEKELAS